MTDLTKFANVFDYQGCRPLANQQAGGIIRLWRARELVKGIDWHTQRQSDTDMYCFFILPPQVMFAGDDNNFVYNDSMQWLFAKQPIESVELENDSKGHNHAFKRGETKPFWHTQEVPLPTLTLQTDGDSALPFVIIPPMGKPNVKPERRYFVIAQQKNGNGNGN